MSRRRNVTKAFIYVISRSSVPLTSLARKLALCDQALDSQSVRHAAPPARRGSRGVTIPALDPALKSDFNFFWDSGNSDSGSGSRI